MAQDGVATMQTPAPAPTVSHSAPYLEYLAALRRRTLTVKLWQIALLAAFLEEQAVTHAQELIVPVRTTGRSRVVMGPPEGRHPRDKSSTNACCGGNNTGPRAYFRSPVRGLVHAAVR